MALFDKDNPGKNLTNATIWLDAARDSDTSDRGISSGTSPLGCVLTCIGAVAIIFFILALVFSLFAR